MVKVVIKECLDAKEIMATYRVMKQLRPSLEEATYVKLIQSMIAEDRYRLIAAFEDDVCVGSAGFNQAKSLFLNGKPQLYVADLVTDEKCRSKGIGKLLLSWIKEEAKRLGCKAVSLDSGTQRVDAHRFYNREGMKAIALHFFRERSPSPPLAKTNKNTFDEKTSIKSAESPKLAESSSNVVAAAPAAQIIMPQLQASPFK
jgi:GNAT superfamily N-acetyltransferase